MVFIKIRAFGNIRHNNLAVITKNGTILQIVGNPCVTDWIARVVQEFTAPDSSAFRKLNGRNFIKMGIEGSSTDIHRTVVIACHCFAAVRSAILGIVHLEGTVVDFHTGTA